jgi:hypothetical protein
MATGDAIPDLTWVDAILFVGIPAVFGGILQVSYKLTYGSLFSEEQHSPAGDELPNDFKGYVETFRNDPLGVSRHGIRTPFSG